MHSFITKHMERPAHGGSFKEHTAWQERGSSGRQVEGQFREQNIFIGSSSFFAKPDHSLSNSPSTTPSNHIPLFTASVYMRCHTYRGHRGLAGSNPLAGASGSSKPLEWRNRQAQLRRVGRVRLHKTAWFGSCSHRGGTGGILVACPRM